MSYLYALEMRIPDYPFSPVKLGFSRRPIQRAKDLSIGPFPTVCLGHWPAPNGYADEAAIHARFKNYRLFGEWFFPCRELQALIKEKLSAGSVEHQKTVKMSKFETRFRRMFSLRDRARLGLMPDPFSSRSTLAYEFENDINVYMDGLRARWPIKGNWEPETQLLRAEELAPLLGLAVPDVRTRVPSIRLSRNVHRYRLREVREFLEHNVGFVKDNKVAQCSQ